MSVLILVLVIFALFDEAFPQSPDMGRQKLEKQTTSAEKIKWRQNLNNKELENKKKRAKYHQNNATKSTEQLEKEWEKAKISKALSRKKKRKAKSSKMTRSENKRKEQETTGTQR